MGLFNRLFKRNSNEESQVLTGSLGDLAATLNIMTVDEIRRAIASGEFNAADVVAAESSSEGKNRKGVLALG